jgi:competence protein ComEA
MKHTRRFFAAFVALAIALSALPAMAAPAGQVNLNTATAEQLALLPRVGPALALRIIEHREKDGQFKKAEELMLVKGIGEKTFELMAPYVTVSGSTTLAEKVRVARKTEAQPEG